MRYGLLNVCFKYGLGSSWVPVVSGLSSTLDLIQLLELLGGIVVLQLLSLLLELLLLGLDGLDISGDEEINHDIPFSVLELSSEELDFPGEHPVDDGDGAGNSVVAGDHNVDVVERSIGVAEGDAGDVDVAGLNDGLLVALGVGDDEESGLLELLGGLIGEGSWDPPGRGGSSGASVLAELVDCTLSLSLGADDLV